MNAPMCERCHKEPKAKHVNKPQPMNLCWTCFDAWRAWYFGRNYIYCIPIERLIEIHAQLQQGTV